MVRRAAVFLSLSLALSFSAHASTGYAVGDTAAALVAPDASGTPHALAEWRGDWVYLDFCVGWCGPCRLMGTVTQPIQDAFDASSLGLPFQYVTALWQSNTVGVPSTAADAAAWTSTFALTSVPVLHADGQSPEPISQWFASAGFGFVPTGVVIDPDGVIRAIDVGYRSPEELLTQVTHLAGFVDPPPPPPPVITQSLLTSAGFEISTPGTGSTSGMSPLSIPGQNLVFLDFAALPGMAHPAGSIYSDVQNGIETIDVSLADFDEETGLSSDISRTTPWTAYVYSMTWSDGLPRMRAGTQPVTLTLLEQQGGELFDFPTSIVVPDTFTATGVRFGRVRIADVPGAPAHVGGIKFAGLKVAVDTTAQQVSTLGVLPPRPTSSAGLALAPPRPNPAAGPVAIAWTQPGAAPARLEVLDVGGRRVWSETFAAAAGANAHLWDLRDAGGTRVAAGLYFVRVASGDRSASRRVVVTR